MKSSTPLVSVVIPVLNEEAGLDVLLAKLLHVLEQQAVGFEIIFVDDGSTDQTLQKLKTLNAHDARICALSFSRNFGKEIAIAAGLRAARGECVVLMDADLQHPPAILPEFFAKWREGFEVVYGVRQDRGTDGPLRRALSRAFYRIFARFGQTELPEGAGDFRLMDRRAVDALNALPERSRFSKGLYAWVGFKACGVPFDVAPRSHGNSRFVYGRLFSFALDGLTSFSTAPLRLAIYTGVVVSAVALVFAVYYLLRTLFYGTDVPGFPSLIVSVMFFSGLQLIFLGIIGEYLGRVFEEVKRRPLYIVRESVGVDEKLMRDVIPDDRRKITP